MKLRTRINLFTILIVALGILINTIILMVYMSNSLKDDVEEAAHAVGQQQMNSFNGIIDNIITMTQKPMINTQVLKTLTTDTATFSDQQKKYYYYGAIDAMNDFFYSDFFYKNDYVYAVSLISTVDNYVFSKQRSGRSIINRDFSNDQWFQMTLKTDSSKELFFPTSQESLFPGNEEIFSISRKIINPKNNKTIGIIRVDVAANDLVSILGIDSKLENSETVLLDNSQKLIFTTLNPDDWKKEFTQRKKTNFLITNESSKYDFILYTTLPKSSIYKGVYGSVLIILVTGLICVLIALVFSRVTTKQIMKPIRILNKHMKEVRNGNLKVEMPISKSAGEFEEICETFNVMVVNTRGLLQTIREEEEEKKRLEYEALQTQISPHFISNTISTLRWIAYIQGNKTIEEALDSFYHILDFSVREQRELIPISTELEQMKHYVNIVSLRYFNKFNVSYDVELGVEKYQTIKFLLQTLVENSIFHGLEEMSTDGEIKIKIYTYNNQVVYEVYDNGKGMVPDDIQSIKEGTFQRKGKNKIGLHNIDRRIKLIFGEDYGILIQSTVGEYTLVKVILPMKVEGENESISG